MIFVGSARNGFWPRLLAAFAYGLPILLILAPLASFLAYSFFRMEGGQNPFLALPTKIMAGPAPLHKKARSPG